MNKNRLDNIFWSFIGSTFDNIDAFRKELLDYQSSDFDRESLDDICLLTSKIEVDYWCYHGNNQITKTVEIVADNNASLSSIDILFKLHNLVVKDLDAIDHHFFEGLIALDETDIPKFKIRQGS